MGWDGTERRHFGSIGRNQKRRSSDRDDSDSSPGIDTTSIINSINIDSGSSDSVSSSDSSYDGGGGSFDGGGASSD